MLWLVSLILTFLFQMNELDCSEECDGQITNTNRMRITAQDLQKNTTTKSNTEPERHTHGKIQHRRFVGRFCWFYKHTHTWSSWVGQRSCSSHWSLTVWEHLTPSHNPAHSTKMRNEQKWTHLKLTETERNTSEKYVHSIELRDGLSISTTLTQKHTPVLDEEEITHQMSSVSKLSLLNSNESEWRSNRDFSWILTNSLLRKTPIISHVSPLEFNLYFFWF